MGTLNVADFTTLTFDCYGTLIDWEAGILAALRPWIAQHDVEATDVELLETFSQSESRQQHAQPDKLYLTVLADTFRDIAAHFGVEPAATEARSFARSIRDWPAFSDSPASLAYLKRYYRLVIISNVDRESFRHSNEKLGVEFDLIVTAQDVGAYKPDLRNFRYTFERLTDMGVHQPHILHCAQSMYHDHVPAKKLGLATCWVNRYASRQGATPAVAIVKPDLEVPDLATFVGIHRTEIGA